VRSGTKGLDDVSQNNDRRGVVRTTVPTGTESRLSLRGRSSPSGARARTLAGAVGAEAAGVQGIHLVIVRALPRTRTGLQQPRADCPQRRTSSASGRKREIARLTTSKRTRRGRTDPEGRRKKGGQQWILLHRVLSMAWTMSRRWQRCVVRWHRWRHSCSPNGPSTACRCNNCGQNGSHMRQRRRHTREMHRRRQLQQHPFLPLVRRSSSPA
jgi:hypothetical protein